ncbi:MAG: chemotaxis protein CheX [Treponema sp.]|jgi:chemotaxis protein CheX|nr:chemotaxis protein CheX [Treponema sp.]
MEKYIQPFVDVTKNVFREFIGAEPEAGRPYFSTAETINEWDISAVIGLTGEANGAVVISMKTGLAEKLTDTLTGKSHDSIDDEVVDAIGEIVNIIAGNAKRGLEEAFRLVISLPTIVQGPAHQIKWPSEKARIICIPFTIYNTEVFTLSVAIEAVRSS